MSKTLEQRILDASSILDRIETGINGRPGSLLLTVEQRFRYSTSFKDVAKQWGELHRAREASRKYLDGLETRVDANGRVSNGFFDVEFSVARFLGCQAYLATTWALADSITSFVGQVLCTVNAGDNPRSPPRLVGEFVGQDRKKTTASMLYLSIRDTFGWPIALLYSVRNHFIHDGAQRIGISLFSAAAPASGFAVADDGWESLEKKAEEHGVSSFCCRPSFVCPTVPVGDLRAIFSACEPEMDEALGVLIASGCGSLASHVGSMLGED